MSTPPPSPDDGCADSRQDHYFPWEMRGFYTANHKGKLCKECGRVNSNRNGWCQGTVSASRHGNNGEAPKNSCPDFAGPGCGLWASLAFGYGKPSEAELTWKRNHPELKGTAAWKYRPSEPSAPPRSPLPKRARRCTDRPPERPEPAEPEPEPEPGPPHAIPMSPIGTVEAEPEAAPRRRKTRAAAAAAKMAGAAFAAAPPAEEDGPGQVEELDAQVNHAFASIRSRYSKLHDQYVKLQGEARKMSEEHRGLAVQIKTLRQAAAPATELDQLIREETNLRELADKNLKQQVAVHEQLTNLRHAEWHAEAQAGQQQAAELQVQLEQATSPVGTTALTAAAAAAAAAAPTPTPAAASTTPADFASHDDFLRSKIKEEQKRHDAHAAEKARRKDELKSWAMFVEAEETRAGESRSLDAQVREKQRVLFTLENIVEKAASDVLLLQKFAGAGMPAAGLADAETNLEQLRRVDLPAAQLELAGAKRKRNESLKGCCSPAVLAAMKAFLD